MRSVLPQPAQLVVDTATATAVAVVARSQSHSVLPAVALSSRGFSSATQPVPPPCSYLAQHGEDCRQPIPALDAEGEEAAARSSTFHTGLLHA